MYPRESVYLFTFYLLVELIFGELFIKYIISAFMNKFLCIEIIDLEYQVLVQYWYSISMIVIHWALKQ